MKRLPLIRNIAMSTASVDAVNVGFTEQQFKDALFVAGRELGLFRK